MERTTRRCVWPRVLYHTQFITICAATVTTLALLLAQASASAVYKALAIFAGVRLGWALWIARPSGLAVGAPPPSGATPAKGYKVLSEEQLEFFERCGYLVLSQVVPKADADKFVAETIFPGLRAQGIDPDEPSGWHTGEKWQIILPACCRGGRK